MGLSRMPNPIKMQWLFEGLCREGVGGYAYVVIPTFSQQFLSNTSHAQAYVLLFGWGGEGDGETLPQISIYLVPPGVVLPSCPECKARIWGRFRKSVVTGWQCPQRDCTGVGGQQWGGDGLGCRVHIMDLSSLVKSHQKYTHPSLLPTGMRCAYGQPSVELRKCLQLGQGNAKRNNKAKELPAFNALGRQGHFGAPKCLVSLLLKTRTYWNSLTSEFQFFLSSSKDLVT